jgi:hypothetical protein
MRESQKSTARAIFAQLPSSPSLFLNTNGENAPVHQHPACIANTNSRLKRDRCLSAPPGWNCGLICQRIYRMMVVQPAFLSSLFGEELV